MTLHRLLPRLALILIAAALAVCLAVGGGCSGSQNDTIGTGDVSLVFTNQGDTSSPMVVSWATNAGTATQHFTVLVGGQVTLKAPRRLVYDIQMSPTCAAPASAPSGPAKQDQVIDATGH
jgi:hypothetical protein